MNFKANWFTLLTAILCLVGTFLPYSTEATSPSYLIWISIAMLAFAFIAKLWSNYLLLFTALACSFFTVTALNDATGQAGYWLLLFASLLCSFTAVGHIALKEESLNRLGQLVARVTLLSVLPMLFLLLWQGLVVGNQIPKGIFPAVSDVYTQLRSAFPVLINDSYTTFVKEVLFGLVVGVLTGFLAGIAIAFSVFLQRGFLPLAAAFGAVPIVGLAPVLGRAFGVDWESKAAVVVIVTFFPVLLNTVQGLVSVDQMKLELLQAYAAKPREIFFKLRLPNALPYIFNALKLAVVISVISVIVAEFLIPGPPRGLGQRISLSARQGAYDLVFAAIFVSSVVSISLYGIVSWLERKLTGWHPSFRTED